jgi:hypothetical protein
MVGETAHASTHDTIRCMRCLSRPRSRPVRVRTRVSRARARSRATRFPKPALLHAGARWRDVSPARANAARARAPRGRAGSGRSSPRARASARCRSPYRGLQDARSRARSSARFRRMMLPALSALESPAPHVDARTPPSACVRSSACLLQPAPRPAVRCACSRSHSPSRTPSSSLPAPRYRAAPHRAGEFRLCAAEFCPQPDVVCMAVGSALGACAGSAGHFGVGMFGGPVPGACDTACAGCVVV